MDQIIAAVPNICEGTDETFIDEITTRTETIRKSGEKILDRARIMRETLEKQVALLLEKSESLKDLTHGQAASDGDGADT